MTSNKKITNLVHRAVIIPDSQNAVIEHILSKQEEQKLKKYPEWDIPRVCPAFEVIRAHQELAEAEKILQKKRLEQEKKRKSMDEQWIELRHQELLLRQSFIKFNKFVRENYEKRERAEHKIKEEFKRQRLRQEEIQNLTQELDYLSSVRDKMKIHVEEYKKYKHYLDRVVNETGEFQSVNDIFYRYETLLEARSFLSVQQDKNIKTLELTELEIYQMTEEKSQMLVSFNNKLAMLQGRFKKAKTKALYWESIVSKIKAIAAKKNLELTQIKECCWNVYQQICKRKGIPAEVAREDIEQQLVHIKRTILELKRIIQVAKKKAGQQEKH